MSGDRYYRRGHWVRRSVPKARGWSWKVWAGIVVVAYFLLHSCLGMGPSDAPPATTGTPSVSAPAHR